MAKVDYLDKGISSMQPMIDAAPHSNNDSAGVVLSEEKCLGYINLRLAADNAKAAKAVAKTLGTELPSINQTASSDDITVLCFSPNEWLVITPTGEEALYCQKLNKALASEHSLVSDVSGGTTKLNISGNHAQDLLEKGTYVDLHDSVFKVGQLYNTQIAHAPAVIVKNAANDFSLIVRRSFSNHIANWAIDGAAEYGFSFS